MLTTGGFTRGLAIDDNHILLGVSVFATDRARRDAARAWIDPLVSADSQGNGYVSIVRLVMTLDDVLTARGHQSITLPSRARQCRGALSWR